MSGFAKVVEEQTLAAGYINLSRIEVVRISVLRRECGDFWVVLRGRKQMLKPWRAGTLRLNGLLNFGISSVCRRLGMRFPNGANSEIVVDYPRKS